MPGSGSYAALSPQNDEVIVDAYERCGILGADLTAQLLRSAERSMNLILSSWINKGLNLWTVKQAMLALNPNQASYNLSIKVSAILQATIRTSSRALGGTSFSSAGGTASNAFDGNTNTACTQTVPNGYISYNWGQSQNAIAMVGVQSNVDSTYTLVAEYSNDNTTWRTSVTIPEQTYEQGVIAWFVVPAPTPSKVYRVRETGGAILNVQELYFNTLVNDTIMSPMSMAEYVAIPQKNQTGQPSSFYFDRQITPIVNLWPCPSSLYNNMYYTYTEQPEDVGRLVNVSQIPPRFLAAYTAALAHAVGLKNPEKVPLDRVQYLEMQADKEFGLAAGEDRERVPLRIYPQYASSWTSP